MVRNMKLHFMVIFLFINDVRQANSVSVDHRCRDGGQLSVLWWSQEPYVYTKEEHHHQDEPAEENPPLQGMFPAILSQVIRRCCHSNTIINYTNVPEGPASLDKLLVKNSFDAVIPAGANVGAETVRQVPFVGVLESPGVAVLIKGNVSGTQLLLSVLQGWPILVFILISATLAGVVIWLVVSGDIK